MHEIEDERDKGFPFKTNIRCFRHAIVFGKNILCTNIVRKRCKKEERTNTANNCRFLPEYSFFFRRNIPLARRRSFAMFILLEYKQFRARENPPKKRDSFQKSARAKTKKQSFSSLNKQKKELKEANLLAGTPTRKIVENETGRGKL